MGALRCELAALQVSVGLFIRRDHARARAGFDCHVADGEAAFHAERADCVAGKFNRAADAAGSADFRDDGEHDVLGGDAGRRDTIDRHAQSFRLLLPQALRREYLLQLRSADADRVRTERAVRRRMRIAAGDDEAGLRNAELRAEHVHDPLLRMLEAVIILDVVGLGVLREEVEHVAHFGIGDGGHALVAVARRHIVIGGGEGLARFAYFAAVNGECGECMERAFVHEIAVNVQQRFVLAAHDDHVAVPDFFEHGLRHQVSSG